MATLRGVTAASASIAWASGSGSTVLHTTDGGATWQRQTVSADRLDFRDIDAVSVTTAYALSIGAGALSRIFKTSDSGATWTQQYQAGDPKIFLDAMSFWDERHGIVLGDSIEGHFFVLTTADGGASWSRVPPDAMPSALDNEGGFAASGTNIAVWGSSDAWIGTGASSVARVLHTPDGGKTWSVAETPLASGASSGIFSVAFRDALHGVVVGGDYRKEAEAIDNLAITRDGGRTWILPKGQSPAAPGQYLSGFRSVVKYVPGTSMLIAVGPQGSDWSEDDGLSWIPIGGPGFHTFAFAPDGTVGWGAGNRGAIGRLDR